MKVSGKMGAWCSRREDHNHTEVIISEEGSVPEKAIEAMEAPPHEYKSILGNSDTPIPDPLSVQASYDLLYAGVFLDDRRKKYWVEKKSKKNCFMLFARDLSIAWSDNSSYWQWLDVKDTPSDVTVKAAQLVHVCWFEALGRFDVSKLSPKTTYEILYVILIMSSAYGWEVPVNLRLTLLDGVKQEHKENLREKPQEKWIEIPAGELRSTSNPRNGEIEMSMFEHGGHWKSGVVIKGVLIRPKD